MDPQRLLYFRWQRVIVFVQRLSLTISLPIVLLLFLLWGLSISTNGTQAAPALQTTAYDWYVSPLGDDGNLCNVRTAPCRKVQVALDKAYDGDVINVAQGIYTDSASNVAWISKSITLRGGWNENFTIRDPNTYPSVLDGRRQGSVIYISGQNVFLIIWPTIDGFVVTGGDGTDTPGCTAPAAGGCGGGIFGINAIPNILNNVITDNLGTTVGQGYGGGLYLEGIQLGTLISGNLVISNVAAISRTTVVTGFGGGMSLYFISTTIQNNHVQNNVASDQSGWGYGGGIYLLRSATTVISNVITNNTASITNRGYGGGISVYQCRDVYNCDGNMILDNFFQHNVASLGEWGLGGAIQLGNTTAIVSGNLIVSNVASLDSTKQGDGGALFGLTGDWILRGNRVVGNVATTGQRGFGGGFQLEYGQVTVEYNTFVNNVASRITEPISGVPSEQIIGYGGAVNFRGCVGNCLMHHNVVSGNIASEKFSGYGGGVCVRFDPVTLDSNLIINNRATLDSNYHSWGGAVRADRASLLTMTNNIIANNYAQTRGGGIHIWGTGDAPSSVRLVHNTIAENNMGPNDRANVGIYFLGNVTSVMTNNILADHTYGFYLEDFEGAKPQATANRTLLHNNSVTDVFGVMTNIDAIAAPPRFVDSSCRDYHLEKDSAAHHAGIATFVLYDFEGDIRSRNGQVDLGADEIRSFQVYLPLLTRDSR